MRVWRVWALGLLALSAGFAEEEKIVKESPLKQVQAPLFYNQLVVDPYFSPYMGAEDLYTVFDGISRLEDYMIPAMRKHSKKWGAMFIRLIDNEIWLALGLYMEIWQHEYFGHGFRIRSLGSNKVGVTSYQNDMISGSTGFYINERTTSFSELNAIGIAGLEAEDIMVRTIGNKWIQSGEIDSRISSIYSAAALSSFDYALSSLGDKPLTKNNHLSDGNDILGYVFSINTLYPEADLTTTDVARRLSCNLLDPLFWYGFYSRWYYVIVGKKGPVPMFSFDISGNQLKFLPSFRARLTPYGIENDVVGYFKFNGRPFTVDFRWGELAQFTFGGVHVDIPTLVKAGKSSFGIEVDLWKQPNFEVSPSLADFELVAAGPLPSRNRYGAALMVNGQLDMTESNITQPYLKIGYKTKGYYPGYILRRGWIGRVGIATRF